MSIRRVVDNSATLQSTTSYSSYGVVTSGSIFGILGYTGRPTDSITSTIDLRARDYLPDLGRFLSEDPAGFAAGDSNLYRYVGNSPTNATDPSGMWLFTPPDPIVLPSAGSSGSTPTSPAKSAQSLLSERFTEAIVTAMGINRTAERKDFSSADIKSVEERLRFTRDNVLLGYHTKYMTDAKVLVIDDERSQSLIPLVEEFNSQLREYSNLVDQLPFQLHFPRFLQCEVLSVVRSR